MASSPSAPDVSPGKRAPTQRLAQPRSASAIQRRAAFAATPRPSAEGTPATVDDPFGFHLTREGTVQRQATAPVAGADVHAHAQRGVEGVGQPLPHQATIQAAFGHHGLGGVRAHVGGAATEAATAIGAAAYATGDDVAFASAPDLHTAAHEAAHVVQQRAGVQLYGGIGEVGDRYECHADQVADAVVAGRSAAALLDTMAGGRDAAPANVQRSPGHVVQGSPGEARVAAPADVVTSLMGPQAAPDVYLARHWQALRDAVRKALTAADLAWPSPLAWAKGSPAERVEVALDRLWPELFVRGVWDGGLARDLDEAVELGLAVGNARQAQSQPDDDRLARYHPAVGTAVGNTIVRRLQRSLRAVGADYVAAHEAGGGEVDVSALPLGGTSDRAAVELLRFARVDAASARPRPAARPGGERTRRRRPTQAPEVGASKQHAEPGDDGASAEAVARTHHQLRLLVGLVGEANADALAPAFGFLTDAPSGDDWPERVARQGAQLEVIRGEVLTLVALAHRDVPFALKADAIAAYARAAGSAHLPDGARLLRLAREEVAELDQRYAVTAARDEARAVESRDPARVPTSDVEALEARAARATRGDRGAARAGQPADAQGLDAGRAGAGGDAVDLATDARTSRVEAFRHGALRLAETLTDARAALTSARELVGSMLTAPVARDVEALAGELGDVEALLHELTTDVMARAGAPSVTLVEEALIGEAEARFRDFVQTSGVLELGRRVQAMLQRVESAAQILSVVGLALVMISASVVGSLAGAYVGGAVRGALTPAAVAAAGETTTAAAVGGTVASVVTESIVVGGVQTLFTEDSFGAAAGENIAAAGLTFAALGGVRWAGVLVRARATWARGAVARYLGGGAIELAVGMGANTVAHSLTHPDAPASDDQLVEWTTAAASMVVGRWIGGRLDTLHARLDAVGARHGASGRRLIEIAQVQREIELLQADVAGRARQPEEFDPLIDDKLAPLAMRVAALEAQAAPGAAAHRTSTGDAAPEPAGPEPRGQAAGEGEAPREPATAHDGDARRGGDGEPARDGAPEPLHDGAPALPREVHAPGPRVHGDGEVAPVGDATSTGKTADAEVALKAHASAARARIVEAIGDVPISSQVSSDGRPSYFIKREDGAALKALLAQLPEVRVNEFPRGLTIHRDGSDWFLAWMPEHGAPSHGLAAGRGGGVDGLPAPNASLVLFYGFRGINTVDGVYWKKLPPDKLRKVQGELRENGLLHYGHVGISFDGGRTIYGLTPSKNGMTTDELMKKVLNHEPVPALVRDDTATFNRARQLAQEGWDLEITTAALAMDEATRTAAFGENARLNAASSGPEPMGKDYQFPYEQPNEQGSHYANDHSRNCATYPQMLGLCVPLASGQMRDYMVRLREWHTESPVAPRGAQGKDKTP